MTLYMKVTKDEYELPLMVEDSLDEFARRLGTTKGSILSALSHKHRGWARVKVEDDDLWMSSEQETQ